MSKFDDPPEHVGRDASAPLADPKPRKTVNTPRTELPLRPSAASLVPATYGENSHSKVAIARPLREHEDSVAEVDAAMAEQRDAKLAMAEAERIEGEALAAWQALQPKISPDQLLRDYAKAGIRATPMPSNVGRSQIDILASQRSRQSPAQASNPLRSATPRRVV
jgi:hypothetical protein